MMTYDEFKEKIADEIKIFLPEKFMDSDVHLSTVQKNHETLDGLTVTSPDSNVAPTIYLNSYYESYLDGEDIYDIMQHIGEVRMEHEIEQPMNLDGINDFEKIKDRIVPIVIGEEGNANLLAERPHTMMDDLAAIYAVHLASDMGGSLRMPISNSMLNTWGISVEELHNIAVSNMDALTPSVFKSMKDTLVEIMLPELIEECNGNREMAELMLSSMIPPENENLYVLTNSVKTNGATALLDDKIMDTIREQVGDNFYILPSSVHECLILVADDRVDPAALEAMVQKVNATEVNPQDRLSNHVYQYDCNTHELYRADRAEERAQSEKSAEHETVKEVDTIEKSDNTGKSATIKKAEKPAERVSLKARLAEKKQQVAGEKKDPAMGRGKQNEASI